MNGYFQRAASGSAFHFGIAIVGAVAWLILGGLLFASITRPAAIDASVERVLAYEVEPEPTPPAVASVQLLETDAGLP
jgi:hypothetical protein